MCTSAPLGVLLAAAAALAPGAASACDDQRKFLIVPAGGTVRGTGFTIDYGAEWKCSTPRAGQWLLMHREHLDFIHVDEEKGGASDIESDLRSLRSLCTDMGGRVTADERRTIGPVAWRRLVCVEADPAQHREHWLAATASHRVTVRLSADPPPHADVQRGLESALGSFRWLAP